MTYTKDEVLLSAKNIHLEFPVEGQKPKVILDGVNFEVRNFKRPGVTQGQIVSLIGRSGCGKTQLLKMCAGLLKPTSGEILANVEQRAVVPGDMGLVPQNYYLFPWRRIRKILEMAAEKNPQFKDEKIRKDAVDHYIHGFELQDHVDKFPRQLSGGQKQRVSISQQLLNGSNFLLMDEPFSGLDTLMIDKTTAMLTNIALTDELKTIIIVSHDLSNSVAISDTVFVLSKKGRTDEQGATIIKEFCLAEMGLAWRPDIKEQPMFHETLKEIKTLL